jgi:3-phenylpropionate/trans-cinnamate dioxygenase ferredoxin subunit
MFEKKIHWFKIAESIDELGWQSNNIAIAEVNNNKISIIRTKDNLFACAHKCPHAGGILAEGFIDEDNNIICPVHSYRFSLINGRNVSGEDYHLKIYKIEKREDGLYIGLK